MDFCFVFFPFLDTNGVNLFEHTYYQLGLGVRFYVFPYKAGTGIGYFKKLSYQFGPSE
jgi:hypothetical protein